MSNPYLILWCDPTTNKLYSGWRQNTQALTPILKQGDEVGVELHWVKRGDYTATMQEIAFPPSVAITLAVGRLDSAPIGGTFKFTYGANSTADLDYDVTATEVQTALNGLASIAADGGVTVTKSGNQFRIVWNNKGAYATALTATVDALYPTSQASIVETKAGSATANRVILVKIRQSAIAANQTWTATDQPAITVTNIFTNTWRVEIYPAPKEGVFSLTVTRNAVNYVTSPISYNDDALRVATVLNATGTQNGSYTVIKSGDFTWDITVPSTVSNITATSGLIGFSAMYGVLDMNTAEVEEFLAGAASGEATLEVQADISGEIQTLIQTDVTILNDLIDVSSFNVVNLGDVMPVDSVVRYDTAQSLTSAQQLQARDNIGAVDSSSIAALQSDITDLDGRVIAVEGLLDQPVKTTSDAVFKSVSVTLSDPLTTDKAFEYNPAGNGYKFSVSSIGNLFGEWIDGGNQIGYWSINNEEGFNMTDVANGSISIHPSGISLSYPNAGITFSDSTTQTTAFVANDYLSKAGNLSGLTSVATARSNLGLGTMALENTGSYLTSSTAAATYLTIANAANTYAPLFDQNLNTTDSVTFVQGTFGDPVFSVTTVNAYGIVFPSTNQLENVAHSAGTIQTGAGTNITDAAYPDEIEIVIGGVTYRVPARTI